ncbi:hypothetical protein MNBD_PLANCTO02-2203 [hydrothermal vent metagenome]|uniref:Cytochrome c domain-containing protein n=1 Tax=hydrothermal vent metagenome TaxID=652676 RepID=A0A3B1DXI9_9ZZZZ
MNKKNVLNILLLLLCVAEVSAARANEPASAVGPVMRILKSGRLPAERLGAVIEIVCQRGNEHDLAYLFEQVMTNKKYSGKLQQTTWNGLRDAYITRKVKPAGDLSPLANTIQNGKSKSSSKSREVMIQLCGLWKIKAAGKSLQQIILDKKTTAEIKKVAIDAIVIIGGKEAKETIEKLVSKEQPLELRVIGVVAFAKMDKQKAAQQAARILSHPKLDTQSPSSILSAFLNLKGGSNLLAKEIAKNKLSVDTAKRCLRYMYSVGRNDAGLSDALSKAAGISNTVKKLTPIEVKRLAAEALKKGDAARGELVFRRADVSCMKCHSVSKAGGNVGPDLSPVGASSPVDYLVNSIIDPNQAVKEAFKSAIVETIQGKVVSGIIVDQNDERIVLRDATGKKIIISADDIDEQVEGGSLMPQGLTKFLTHDELLDLVKFLSSLGKPGAYAVQTTPAIHRWRVIQKIPASLQKGIPDEETVRGEILSNKSIPWVPAYSKVAGMLPLMELRKYATNNALYLKGEIDVTEGGVVGIQLNSNKGINIWVDHHSYRDDQKIVSDLHKGRHAIIIRVDLSQRNENKKEIPEIKVEFFKPEGSTAQFTVVVGP